MGHYCCMLETHHDTFMYDDLRQGGRMWQVGVLDGGFFHKYAGDSSEWYIQEAIYPQIGALPDYHTVLTMHKSL